MLQRAGSEQQVRSKMSDDRYAELLRRIEENPPTNINPPATEDENKNANIDWRLMKDYAAGIDLNRRFIKGESNCTIYHCGPLDAESENLKSSLLNLHDYGILTHESQPFNKRIRAVREPWKDGWWIQQHQRPFLTFLLPVVDRIPADHVDKFCGLLMAHSSIFTLMCADMTAGPCTNMTGPQVVTKNRTALSIEELLAEGYNDSLTFAPGAGHAGHLWGIKAILNAGCLDFTIVSRSWEEDLDLLALVGDVARKAGMEKLYAE